MISASAALPSSYNYSLVALSALISVAASYTALDLGGRVTAAGGLTRSIWLICGAAAMGLGIWSMHFVAMMAFILPIPVSYYYPTVLLALLTGILSSAFALFLVSREKMDRRRAIAGSVLMGAGIAGLHYIAMDAMRMAALTRYDLRIVAASVLLAILFSLAALLLAFDLREETRGTPSRKVLSALFMGAAISAMHYTGMASATFIPATVAPDLSDATTISSLGKAGIAVGTLMALGLTILTCALDRRRLAIQAKDLERLVADRTRDITLINIQLRESEARFRLLFEQNMAGVAIANQGHILNCNRAWARILGYETPDEIRGRPTTDFYFRATDREPILQRLARGDPLIDQEIQLKRKDGTPVWVLSNAVPFKVGADAPLVISTVIDITERKSAELRLREYEKVVEALEEMIMVVDRDYRYVIVNHAFLRYRGMIEEQVIGRRVPEILNPGIFETEIKPRLDQAFGGQIVEFELRYRYKELGERDLSVSYFPIEDSGGITRVACILQDITERKRAEQSLQEAQQELARVSRVLSMGELVTSIAHEVNQPLTAVVTTGNFALRQLDAGSPNLRDLREAIAEIVEDGTRASAIIARIRELLQKSSSGRVELNMNDIIQEVVYFMRNEAIRNNVTVRLNLSPHLPPVVGDRVQLQQVLINLMMNAFEAMRAVTNRSRELLVSTATSNGNVLVEVQDSGKGIDPQQRERIFEPFFTTKPLGIGIGLSISRSIVESHGGSLWVTSSSGGARFHFTLPEAGETL